MAAEVLAWKVYYIYIYIYESVFYIYIYIKVYYIYIYIKCMHIDININAYVWIINVCLSVYLHTQHQQTKEGASFSP